VIGAFLCDIVIRDVRRDRSEPTAVESRLRAAPSRRRHRRHEHPRPRRREHALQELPGWERNGDVICKTFVHDDFHSAMAFVDRVAEAAEAAGHHPDIDIRWNKVTLALTSHDAGGLTSADTALAHRIQRLVGDHHHPPGLAGP